MLPEATCHFSKNQCCRFHKSNRENGTNKKGHSWFLWPFENHSSEYFITLILLTTLRVTPRHAQICAGADSGVTGGGV